MKSETETTEQPEPQKTCADCNLFRGRSCGFYKTYVEVWPTDLACGDFQPKGDRGERGEKGAKRQREKKEKEYKLDIYAEVPPTIKPCGFYPEIETLTESTWLPYKDEEDNITLRPSVIIKERKKEARISDYILGVHDVKGTFPSQDLPSLMSQQGVQMLISNMDIEPRKVDEQIDEALHKHLSIPDAERILAKRWIEGTHFYDIFNAFPLESVLGCSESGKTRLNLLNLALTYHAQPMIFMTEAGIFRSKEEDKVSLCVDEGEYLNAPNLHQTIRILMNASYSKYGGVVVRYDEENGKRIKRTFDLYSPMTICGIGGLEGVTLSRAFRIVMRRVNKDYPPANPKDYQTLRDMLYVLRIRHAFDIHGLYKLTDISNISSARFQELFTPLFVMTEFFGSSDEKEILTHWCREYEENFRVEALNVFEEEMVLVCLSKLKPILADWFSIKELADAVNNEYSRKVSSKHVSGVLTRLGLVKRKKYTGYMLVYAPKELLEESATRIGISLSFCSPNSPNSPTSNSSQPKIEKFDDVCKPQT